MVLDVVCHRPGDTETKSGGTDGQDSDWLEEAGKCVGDIVSEVDVLFVRADHQVKQEEGERG